MCIRVGQALTGQRGNITALGIDAVDFKHHLNTERWWPREGWDADISSPLQIRWGGDQPLCSVRDVGKDSCREMGPNPRVLLFHWY